MKKLQSVKFIMITCLISLLLLCVAWKLLKLHEFYVYEMNISNQEIALVDDLYAYDLKLDCSNKNIFMNGWFIKKGKSTNNKTNLHIIIRNQTTNKSYILPAELVIRPDVTDYFKANQRFYDWSGFIVKKEKINIPNGMYEILIMYEYSDDSGMVKLKELLEVI